MKSKFNLEITKKTKILNLLRNIFKIKPFERFLLKRTIGKHTDNFWVRLIPSNYLYPKNSLREVSRNGIIYLLDISDLMEHAIYFGYEDYATKKLFELAKDRKVIIDVGVNIGSTLFNFARLSPDGVIVGFEPDPTNFQKAENNLKLNNFKNIILKRKGLGNENIKTKLFKVNEQNAGMNRILDNSSKNDTDKFDFEEIAVVRFDDFVIKNNFPQIDLIKIDVEGYELKVLIGAQNSLERYKPTLFIELDDNNLKDQKDSAHKLILFLENLQYKIYKADDESIVSSADNFSNCIFDIVCTN